MKYKKLKDDIIEKSDFSIKVPIEDIKNHYKDLTTRLTELTAQGVLEATKMENYTDHNPIIEKTSEKDMNAIYLYHKSFMTVKACDEQIESINTVIKDYKKEVKQINKQTGLKIKLDAKGDGK